MTTTDVRCAYLYQGQECLREPDDFRIMPLNEADGLVVLLCSAHCQAYDSIAWANRKCRQSDI